MGIIMPDIARMTLKKHKRIIIRKQDREYEERIEKENANSCSEYY
jgi:hypothetical protein